MDIFFEIHQDLPREGPGCNEATRKAFMMISAMPSQPLILDVGCGPGAQTLELAKLSEGYVIGVDNHLPFLKQLKTKAREARLSDRIKTLNGSMFEMSFKEGSFDLIWAEGSIYIMGFEKGLKNWRHFLKPGGFLSVTEVSWLKENPPQELYDFWMRGYPAIKNIQENQALIQKCGYKEIGYFLLEEKAWWDDYYNPLEKRIQKLRQKYRDDKEALLQLDEESYEISLYRRFSEWYSYVFYIMKKQDMD